MIYEPPGCVGRFESFRRSRSGGQRGAGQCARVQRFGTNSLKNEISAAVYYSNHGKCWYPDNSAKDRSANVNDTSAKPEVRMPTVRKRQQFVCLFIYLFILGRKLNRQNCLLKEVLREREEKEEKEKKKSS